MKKIFLLIGIILLAFTEILSQSSAPGILNYQGVARNSVGNVLPNKAISLRLTIRDNSAAGPVVYQETRGVTTNPFGLFNVQLGSPGASGVVGTIATVPWGIGLKYIQVEIDPNGGSSFINIGTAQLASVPYSLFSSLANDLILPFSKTQTNASTLFRVNNSGSGGGVHGAAISGVGVQGTATTGTGGSFSSTSGLAVLTAGNLRLTGILEGAAILPNTFKILGGDAAGNATWQHASAIGLVSGSGTLNYVPKWTPNGTNLGNSQIFDDGTAVGIGTITPVGRVHSFRNSAVVLPHFMAEEDDNDYARFTFKTTNAANSGNNFWTIAGYNNDNRNLERLNFWNNATGDLMSITGNGNVGIGIFNPVGRVHSFRNSNVILPHFMAEEDDNDYARFTFKTTNALNSGNNFWSIAGYNNDNRNLERLNFWNNATGDLMSITGNGNVGIGTINPTVRLHAVADQSGAAIQILRNINAAGFSSSWYLSSGGGNMGHFGYGNPGAFAWANQMFAGSIAPIPFVFTTSDIERMRISSIGNVGIGINNPTAKLHLIGNINITDGTEGLNKVLTSDASGNGSWQNLGGLGAGLFWNTTGNSGTDTAINFLGTLDDKPLMLRQNNLWMGQLNTRRHSFFIGGGAGFYNDNVQNTGFGDSTLYNNTTGIGNTAVGHRAMVGSGPITGNVNTAVGNNALTNITSGFQNVAIGDYAAHGLEIGGLNVIIGPGAMEGAKEGIGNIAMGLWANRLNESGSHNYAIGIQSLYNHKQNVLNIGLGYQSLFQDTASIGNTALGHYALRDHQTGNLNTAVGHEALQFDSAGNLNVAVGWRSMRHNKNGRENTAIGVGSLEINEEGSYNVAVGRYANFRNRSGNLNVAMGYQSLFNLDSANNNTAIGSYSLNHNLNGHNNTAIGYAALYEDSIGEQNTAIGVNALRLNKIASQNTAVGFNALYYNTYSNIANDELGSNNNALGWGAGLFNTNGKKNIAIGNNAFRGTNIFNNINDQRNIAIGDSALGYNIFGVANIAIGAAALSQYYNGNENTAVGDSAMAFNNGSGGNDAFGHRTLKNIKYSGSTFSSFWNTAIGGESMEFDTSAYANVAVGFRSLRNPSKAYESTAIGVGAMEFGDSTFRNVAVGRGAMFNFGNARENTAVGTWSMSNKKTGYYNTAVGYFAMQYDTSGLANTALGTSALRNNLRSNDNVAIGFDAGYYSTGSAVSALGGNSFVGAYAGLGQNGLSTGTLNTVVGFHAFQNFTTATSNVAIGFNTMRFTETGTQNTAVGEYALFNNLSGFRNVALGAGSLEGQTASSDNVGIGFWAGRLDNSSNRVVYIGRDAAYNNQRDEIVAIGYRSLYNNTIGAVSINDGAFNTGIGSYSLSENTTGNQNTALGFSAGSMNTTGFNNTFIGYNANNANPGLTNATAIGSQSYVTQSNSMVLGSINGVNGATADTRVGIGNTSPQNLLHIGTGIGARMQIGTSQTLEDLAANTLATNADFVPVTDNNNTLGSATNRWSAIWAVNGAIQTSDKRDKENIADLNYGLNEIMKLRPVSYTWKEHPAWGKKIGFIAQEVQSVLGEVVQVGALKNDNITKDGNDVSTAADHDKMGIYYADIIPVVVKALQDQQLQIEELKKQNSLLIERLEKLEKK